MGGTIGSRNEKMDASESLIGYCAKVEKVIHVANPFTDKRIQKKYDIGKEEEPGPMLAIPVRNELGAVHGKYLFNHRGY